jgi:glycosyl transferase family 25
MLDYLRVISLDRTPARFEQFRAWNPHLPIQRFSAIDGKRLDRSDCIRDGLITADNTYKPSAIGNALSHVTLWRECAAGAAPMHVVEDDIILRQDFLAVANGFLTSLDDWDFVLWAHNFDWPVMIQPPGVGSIVLQYNPREAEAQLSTFPTVTTRPALLPLISAASSGCYSISPQGAARMLADCLPIGATSSTYVTKPELAWSNSGLDVEMSRHYRNWNAYVSLPTLGVAPNDQSASTIRGHLAAMHDPAIANRATA